MIDCPDCKGTGKGRGFPSKASGVWEPPLCDRCDGRGDLAVTISGDSEHVFLSDEDGRIVGTFASLAEAERGLAGEGT